MEPSSHHGRVSTAGIFSLLILIGVGTVVRADVLVLANGDRVEGEIVGENAREISLRRHFKSSNILYVQKFTKGSISRIEKTPVETQPDASDSAPAERGATSRPGSNLPLAREGMIENWKSGQSLAPDDAASRPIYLRRAIERWKEGQAIAAGSELTRLLTTAKAQELDVLSPECEAKTGMKLPEFAAHVHWTVAKSRAKSGPLRLAGVAPYEVPAIIPLLVKEYDETLRREIEVQEPVETKVRKGGHSKATSRPAGRAKAAHAPALPAYIVPQSQPTSDPAVELANRLTIINWIDRPNELVITRAEAAGFSQRIVYAISLLNERLRLDPAARRDKSLQTTLSAQRMQLLALWRALGDRAEETERAQKHAQVDEQEAVLKDLQKQLDHEQSALLQKALQLAQEQQLQQNAAQNQQANRKGAAAKQAPPAQELTLPATPPDQAAPETPK